MRTDPTFGPRLRALRRSSGKPLTQAASEAGINFTYLSKIENGHMEAPSEATIRLLLDSAGAPRGTSDELLLLAGKIPADVRQIILAHPEACGLLRNRWGSQSPPAKAGGL